MLSTMHTRSKANPGKSAFRAVLDKEMSAEHGNAFAPKKKKTRAPKGVKIHPPDADAPEASAAPIVSTQVPASAVNNHPKANAPNWVF